MRSTVRRAPSQAQRALATASVATTPVREIDGSRGYETHDFREHWIAFTRQIGQVLGPTELAQELSDYVVQASRATSVGVYLAGAEAGYRLAGSSGGARFAPRLDRGEVLSWLRGRAWPAPVPRDLLPSISAPAQAAALAVAIRWRTTLVGFLVLGPPSTGLDYGTEDLRFLETVAGQVAASMVAARLDEAAVHARGPGTTDRSSTAVMHDMKNSVSALSMLARNAADNISDPEFQRDAVATLTRTVERMQRLLVRLASPDGEPAARNEPIDLRELIIEATAPLAAHRTIRLVRRLRPVTTVYGDRDALLRVVENLTTNATEAIDREGTVTVTLTEEAGHVVISVADTGCGIPDEYRERHLYAPFRSTKSDGWGLGLYHTKQMVERQDGELRVESLVGHGTTFTVRLPLRADVEHPSLESVR
jgi:putative PEP-CTERM system histidine kinase